MKFKRQQTSELFICVLTCYNSIIYPDIIIIIIIVIVTTLIMIMIMAMIIKT
jgi:hypothetical protein